MPAHCGALTSFQCKCIRIDQVIYSCSPAPLCLICFPLKCSRLKFLELSSPKWNIILGNLGIPALPCSSALLFCFATKPETQNTTSYNLHSKHPRPTLFTAHHIQNLLQHSTGSNYHLIRMVVQWGDVYHPSIKLIVS